MLLLAGAFGERADDQLVGVLDQVAHEARHREHVPRQLLDQPRVDRLLVELLCGFVGVLRGRSPAGSASDENLA